MKDLAHHLKKLNRRIIRSSLRETQTLMNEPLPARLSKEEKKRARKRRIRIERLARTPIHPSEEERNRAMKKRTPIFDRNQALPKKAKPTKKKVPRI